MDEFFEALVLIQTLRQASFPVILMGSEYWAGLLDWMKKDMLETHQYISPEDMDVFTLVDDPVQAAKIIIDFHKSDRKGGLKEPTGVKKPR